MRCTGKPILTGCPCRSGCCSWNVQKRRLVSPWQGRVAPSMLGFTLEIIIGKMYLPKQVPVGSEPIFSESGVGTHRHPQSTFDANWVWGSASALASINPLCWLQISVTCSCFPLWKIRIGNCMLCFVMFICASCSHLSGIYVHIYYIFDTF